MAKGGVDLEHESGTKTTKHLITLQEVVPPPKKNKDGKSKKYTWGYIYTAVNKSLSEKNITRPPHEMQAKSAAS